MGRYWSLEECCWVEHSSTTPELSGSAADGEAVAGEQIPEQAGHSVAAQREPAGR